MAVKYNGILLTAPTATPFTADATIWGFDVLITATAPATITGANAVTMASLAAGRPLHLGGTDPVSGEPLQLALYSATSAGNVTITYATRN